VIFNRDLNIDENNCDYHFGPNRTTRLALLYLSSAIWTVIMARDTLNIMSDVFRKWLQKVAEQLQCCCYVLQNIQRMRMTWSVKMVMKEECLLHPSNSSMFLSILYTNFDIIRFIKNIYVRCIKCTPTSTQHNVKATVGSICYNYICIEVL